MKNPFIKEDDNSAGLLTGIILGAIAAGGLVYLYFTKRKRLAEEAAYAKEHAQDYLEKKAHQLKKHKTDVHDLAEIVTHPAN